MTKKNPPCRSNIGNAYSYAGTNLSREKAPNPQSWNRYAYVLNNPLRNVDPDGLDCIYLDDSGENVEYNDQQTNPGECGDNHGYWVTGAVTDFQVNDNGSYTFTSLDQNLNTLKTNFPGGANTNSTTNIDVSAYFANYFTQTQALSMPMDTPLAPIAMQFIQTVAQQTHGVEKQANCIAAGAVPVLENFIVTPEDVKGVLGFGEKAAEKGLDKAAEHYEEKAEKLRRWHKKSVPTARVGTAFEYVAGAAKLYAAAKAGVEGGNAFADCEQVP